MEFRWAQQAQNAVSHNCFLLPVSRVFISRPLSHRVISRVLFRAFPSGNAKPASLAEQLKSALAGETGIKVNEIRYIAEDSSIAGAKLPRI